MAMHHLLSGNALPKGGMDGVSKLAGLPWQLWQRISPNPTVALGKESFLDNWKRGWLVFAILPGVLDIPPNMTVTQPCIEDIAFAQGLFLGHCSIG